MKLGKAQTFHAMMRGRGRGRCGGRALVEACGCVLLMVGGPGPPSANGDRTPQRPVAFVRGQQPTSSAPAYTANPCEACRVLQTKFAELRSKKNLPFIDSNLRCAGHLPASRLAREYLREKHESELRERNRKSKLVSNKPAQGMAMSGEATAVSGGKNEGTLSHAVAKSSVAKEVICFKDVAFETREWYAAPTEGYFESLAAEHRRADQNRGSGPDKTKGILMICVVDTEGNPVGDGSKQLHKLFNVHLRQEAPDVTLPLLLTAGHCLFTEAAGFGLENCGLAHVVLANEQMYFWGAMELGLRRACHLAHWIGVDEVMMFFGASDHQDVIEAQDIHIKFMKKGIIRTFENAIQLVLWESKATNGGEPLLHRLTVNHFGFNTPDEPEFLYPPPDEYINDESSAPAHIAGPCPANIAGPCEACRGLQTDFAKLRSKKGLTYIDKDLRCDKHLNGSLLGRLERKGCFTGPWLQLRLGESGLLNRRLKRLPEVSIKPAEEMARSGKARALSGGEKERTISNAAANPPVSKGVSLFRRFIYESREDSAAPTQAYFESLAAEHRRADQDRGSGSEKRKGILMICVVDTEGNPVGDGSKQLHKLFNVHLRQEAPGVTPPPLLTAGRCLFTEAAGFGLENCGLAHVVLMDEPVAPWHFSRMVEAGLRRACHLAQGIGAYEVMMFFGDVDRGINNEVLSSFDKALRSIVHASQAPYGEEPWFYRLTVNRFARTV